MLAVEADILNLNDDCVRLLQGYRELCLDARAVRTKAAADEKKEQAAEEQARQNESTESQEEAAPAEASDPAGSEPLTEEAANTPAPEPRKIDMSDPWVARINELEGVELDELSSMHGRLIAAGLINFQIKNRQTGVEYRVANAGKQYLTKQLSGEDDE